MAATYTPATEHNIVSTVRPSCEHGAAHLKYSSTPCNPGQRYWRCPLAAAGCHLFVWYEHPYEGEVKEAMLYLVNKFLYAEGRLLKAKKVRERLAEQLRATRADVEARLEMAGEEVLQLHQCLTAARDDLETKFSKAEKQRARLESMFEGAKEEMEEKMRVAQEERNVSERKLEADKKDLEAKLALAEEGQEEMEAATARAKMALEEKDKELQYLFMKIEKMEKKVMRSKLYMRGVVSIGMVLVFVKLWKYGDSEKSAE